MQKYFYQNILVLRTFDQAVNWGAKSKISYVHGKSLDFFIKVWKKKSLLIEKEKVWKEMKKNYRRRKKGEKYQSYSLLQDMIFSLKVLPSWIDEISALFFVLKYIRSGRAEGLKIWRIPYAYIQFAWSSELEVPDASRYCPQLV